MRHKGGKKRDKPAGSCRRKGSPTSIKLASGLCNTIQGVWKPINDCNELDMQMKTYYQRQAERAQWNQERNKIARANRGSRGGKKNWAA